MRRIAVAITGTLTLLLGILLLVLPGPGLVTIAAGLGVLATEFDCARRCLEWCKACGGRWSRYVFTSGTSARPKVLKALRKGRSQQS